VVVDVSLLGFGGNEASALGAGEQTSEREVVLRAAPELLRLAAVVHRRPGSVVHLLRDGRLVLALITLSAVIEESVVERIFEHPLNLRSGEYAGIEQVQDAPAVDGVARQSVGLPGEYRIRFTGFDPLQHLAEYGATGRARGPSFGEFRNDIEPLLLGDLPASIMLVGDAPSLPLLALRGFARIDEIAQLADVIVALVISLFSYSSPELKVFLLARRSSLTVRDVETSHLRSLTTMRIRPSPRVVRTFLKLPSGSLIPYACSL